MPTIDKLRARGLIIPNRCCLCRVAAESLDHLFLHCPWVEPLWVFFLNRFGVLWSQPDSINAFWSVGLISALETVLLGGEFCGSLSQRLYVGAFGRRGTGGLSMIKSACVISSLMLSFPKPKIGCSMSHRWTSLLLNLGSLSETLLFYRVCLY